MPFWDKNLHILDIITTKYIYLFILYYCMEWLENAERLVIITNNYCNLQCPRCITGCHDTVNHEWTRNGVWEVELSDIKTLLDKIGSHIPKIRLHGGETTCMTMGKLKQIIDLITSYNIPVGILTNGYNLMGLGVEYLEKLNHIVINGHGINEALLDEIEPQLRALTNPRVIRIKRYDYFDVKECVDTLPKTAKCPLLNKIVGFYKGVLYPCCGPYYNEEDVGDFMGDWCVDSDDFVDVVQSLDNLPRYFWDLCHNRCAWRTEVTNRPVIDIRETVTGVPRYGKV